MAEKLNYSKSGMKRTFNGIKENQKFSSIARRDSIRQRNGSKNENPKRSKKAAQIIWQRLMSGQSTRNYRESSQEPIQIPRTTRIARRSRNEPAWRDILTVEKTGRKIAKLQTSLVATETRETGAEPRTAFSIKMEKRSRKQISTTTKKSTKNNHPSLEQLENSNKTEPIEEFRLFFDNLFSYLQPRVPIEEREFLEIERSKFNEFFERLKTTRNPEVSKNDSNYSTSVTNGSGAIVYNFQQHPQNDNQNSTQSQSEDITSTFSTQKGKMIAVAVQTSLPSSTTTSDSYSIEFKRKNQNEIEKNERGVQVPEDPNQQSLNEDISNSYVNSDETKFDKDQENPEKQRETGGKEKNKIKEQKLECIAYEIDVLETMKENLKRNPNTHNLLKSLKSFYKQLRKEQRQKKQEEKRRQQQQQQESETTTENLNVCQLPKIDVIVEDASNSSFGKQIKEKKSSNIINPPQLEKKSSSNIFPQEQDYDFYSQKRNSTMHVAFEDAAISSEFEPISVPCSRPCSRPCLSPCPRCQPISMKPFTLDSESSPNVCQPFTQNQYQYQSHYQFQNNLPPLTQDQFHYQVQTVCNHLLATRDSLEKLKEDMEKHTTTNCIENNETYPSSTYPPPYEWGVAEDGSIIQQHPKLFENEKTSIFNDQIEKTNLENIKDKCLENQKTQELELNTLFKRKPKIDDNELLHKLDNNVDEMQTGLINLGKQYNYLPLNYLNRNKNEKWHPTDHENSLLLEDFQHCYPKGNKQKMDQTERNDKSN